MTTTTLKQRTDQAARRRALAVAKRRLACP